MKVPPFKEYFASVSDLKTKDQKEFYRKLRETYERNECLDVKDQISYLIALLREESEKGLYIEALKKLIYLYNHEEKFFGYAITDLTFVEASAGNWSMVNRICSIYSKILSPSIILDNDLRNDLGVRADTIMRFGGPNGPSTAEKHESAWRAHVGAAIAKRPNCKEEFENFRLNNLDGGLLKEGARLYSTSISIGYSSAGSYQPLISPIIEEARDTISRQKIHKKW